MNRLKAGALGLGLSFAAVGCANNTESILDNQIAVSEQQNTTTTLQENNAASIGRILCKGPDYKGMGVEFTDRLWPSDVNQANAKLQALTGVKNADVTTAPIGYAKCDTLIGEASVKAGILVTVEGPMHSAVSAETHEVFQSNCAVVGLPEKNKVVIASKYVVVVCPSNIKRDTGTI